MKKISLLLFVIILTLLIAIVIKFPTKVNQQLITLSHKLNLGIYSSKVNLPKLIQQKKIKIANKKDIEIWLKKAYLNSNKKYLFAGEYLKSYNTFIIIEPTKLPYTQSDKKGKNFILNDISLPSGYLGNHSFYFKDGSCKGFNPNCDKL